MPPPSPPASSSFRRRRLRRARRRAGALARGADRAGRALVRRPPSRGAASPRKCAPAAPTRWSSAAPGRRSAVRRSPSWSKAIRRSSSRSTRCASFRISHPAGKIFIAWIAGGRGRAVVAAPRPAIGAADGLAMALAGRAAEPQRRTRERGRDRRPARPDRDRQARRSTGGARSLPLGIDGDEQADLRVHGGPSQAVYAYPSEHYAFWQTVRAQAGVALWDDPLPPGSLGREPHHRQASSRRSSSIGDVLRFPECALAVSEPRFPCFKFNAAMGFKHAAKLMVESAWCGWYLAVREPGTIAAGDAFTSPRAARGRRRRAVSRRAPAGAPDARLPPRLPRRQPCRRAQARRADARAAPPERQGQAATGSSTPTPARAAIRCSAATRRRTASTSAASACSGRATTSRAPLADYVELVRRFNPDGVLAQYPGSPSLAQQLLRPQDELRAFELHPDRAEDPARDARRPAPRDRLRRRRLHGAARAAAAADAARRVLIDPSYEGNGDYGKVVATLRDALTRFADGRLRRLVSAGQQGRGAAAAAPARGARPQGLAARAAHAPGAGRAGLRPGRQRHLRAQSAARAARGARGDAALSGRRAWPVRRARTS